MIERLWRDIQYAARKLRHARLFSVTVVLSLALGLGPATAIFSLVNAVLFQTPSIRNPGELVQLTLTGQQHGNGFSYPLFSRVRDSNTVFSDVASFHLAPMDVRFDAGTRSVPGQYVSGGYFSTLGVSALRGRVITEEDENPEKHSVAVISYRFWASRFGLDPSVVGRQLLVDGKFLTIVGIMGPHFVGLNEGQPLDITVPIDMMPPARLADPNRLWSLDVVGRLKPGMSESQALPGLDLVLKHFVVEFNISTAEQQQVFDHITLEKAAQGSRGLRLQFGKPLAALMAMCGMVLLIACSNTMNLLLARAAARQTDVSLLLALGANRSSLLRQGVIESLLLSLLAAAVSMLFGLWTVSSLAGFVPASLMSNAGALKPDFRVLLFTVALALLIGFVLGMVPVLKSSKVDIARDLQAGSLAVRGRNFNFHVSKALVIGQVGLSLWLLIGAGMFVRTLKNLNNVDAGFNRSNVLLFTASSSSAGYSSTQVRSVYERVLQRLTEVLQARSVTFSTLTPFSMEDETRFMEVPGYQAGVPDDAIIHVNYVGPQFFATLRTPLKSGRDFSARDVDSAPRVGVINEAAARHFFGNLDSLHRVVGLRGTAPFEIIGVAEDSKYGDLRTQPQRMVYLPFFQSSETADVTFAIRTAGDPDAIAGNVLRQVAEVDQSISIGDTRSLSRQVEESLLREYLIAWFAGVLGILALALAAVGLYGMMAYAMAQRTSEIGLRMALGAGRPNILWLFLRESLILMVAGILIGVPSALATMRLMASLLFGLTSTDLTTVAIAIAVMVAVSAIASYIPAWSASRIDPLTALRRQ
jgi:predicted permease